VRQEVYYKHKTWWKLPAIKPGKCAGCVYSEIKHWRARVCLPGGELKCDEPDVIFIKPHEEAFNDYINARTTYRLGITLGEEDDD